MLNKAKLHMPAGNLLLYLEKKRGVEVKLIRYFCICFSLLGTKIKWNYTMCLHQFPHKTLQVNNL